MANATTAFRQFIADPIAKRSAALFIWRASQLLHERTGGRWDAGIVRLIAALRPKVALPSSPYMDERAIVESVAALKKCGWNILPFQLSTQSIDEITQFAFSTPAYALSPSERIPVNANEPPRQHPRYEWRISELISLPAVQNLLADSALYQVAQSYIGCRPVLTSITLWLDTVHDGKFDAHIYHYDNDGPAFLKFFIYLSDVDIDSGAHTYIQGSQGHIKPPQFHRSQRYDRDELLRHYGDANEIVFAAPAGTIIAEDTAGFHRGMDPTTRPRLLMQIEYAALDIPHVEEFILGVVPVRIAGLSAGAALIARKFALVNA